MQVPGFLLLAVVAALPALASAQSTSACSGESDDAKRLACYDALFRASRTAPPPAGAAAAAPVVAPAARNEPSALEQVATAPSGRGLAADDFLGKFWELTPEDKRGTFIVRTYAPNYLLPARYTTRINKFPSSPTHPDGGDFSNYRQAEAELQLSLRAKVAEDILFPNADLWVAYTQHSMWQLWNGADSRPFRSNDYQPEATYVVPVSDRLGDLGGGWRWRMALAGIAHESNGQPDPLSRSWNRLYLGTAFTHDDIALQARYNYRLHESANTDDNPHLTDYIGNTELTATWFPGVSTMQLVGRTSFKSWDRGSLKFSWTHPVFSGKPDGLRWYAQVFTGYGETMLDYNHRQTSIGLGFTLFQL